MNKAVLCADWKIRCFYPFAFRIHLVTDLNVQRDDIYQVSPGKGRNRELGCAVSEDADLGHIIKQVYSIEKMNW